MLVHVNTLTCAVLMFNMPSNPTVYKPFTAEVFTSQKVWHRFGKVCTIQCANSVCNCVSLSSIVNNTIQKMDQLQVSKRFVWTVVLKVQDLGAASGNGRTPRLFYRSSHTRRQGV